MRVPFVKTHGLQNDFIVVSGGCLPAGLILSDWARQICHRRDSIGADGLIVWRGDPGGGPVTARIFNADGSEAENSGNGVRCLAAALLARGGRQWREQVVVTRAGAQHLTRVAGRGGRWVLRSDLGPPRFEAEAIPFLPTGTPSVDGRYELTAAGRVFQCWVLSTGNPQCVVGTEDLPAEPIDRWGPALEHHPAFPARTNVAFLHVTGPDSLSVRFWERGAGPTPASGTGSAAAAVAAIRAGWVQSPVRVHMPGGVARVDWRPGGRISQEAPAQITFRGVVPWP